MALKLNTDKKNPARILVVDDDKYVVKSMEIILKGEGYEVSVANHGNRAVDLLKREKFDLVVTDLKMNGANGLQVLKQTKRLEPDTEVIILTGHNDIEAAIQGLKLGALDYLVKPCPNEIIRMTVKRGLDKRWFEKQRKEISKEIKRRAAELLKLHKISALLLNPVKLNKLLAHVLSEIVSAFALDGGYLAVFRGENLNHLHVLAAEGCAGLKPKRMLRLNDSCVCGAALTNSMILQGHAKSESESAYTIGHCFPEDFSSGIAVPLQTKGRPLGLLCLAGVDQRDFNDYDYSFLTEIAHQLATMLEQAESVQKLKAIKDDLKQGMEKQAAEFANVITFSEKIANVTHVHDLFRILSGFLDSFSNIDVFGLLIHSNRLKFLDLRFKSENGDARRRASLRKEITRIILSGLSCNMEIDGINASLIRQEPDQPPCGLKWYHLLPLKNGRNCPGVIFVASVGKSEMTREQKRVFTSVAHQITLAIRLLNEKALWETSKQGPPQAIKLD